MYASKGLGRSCSTASERGDTTNPSNIVYTQRVRTAVVRYNPDTRGCDARKGAHSTSSPRSGNR